MAKDKIGKLKISRLYGQSFWVGDAKITLRKQSGSIGVEIDAPKNIIVLRSEVRDALLMKETIRRNAKDSG